VLFANSCQKEESDDKITDMDGNVYSSVTIGTQVWMVENLKTTKYSDGTAIPLVTDDVEWMNLNGHAYCWYNNDPGENKNTYGALYNWYAIYTDKLCPSGWHIPELADWNTLIDNLGGASSAGGKLKESGTTHWKTTNTEVTNQSGFTALPAGYRSSWTGEFGGIGRDTYWWTNSGSLVYLPEAVYIHDNEIKVHTGTEWRETGFSVRCIKD